MGWIKMDNKFTRTEMTFFGDFCGMKCFCFMLLLRYVFGTEASFKSYFSEMTFSENFIELLTYHQIVNRIQ